MPDYTFTGTGQFVQIHDSTRCEPPCTLHSPSEHHMVTWPLHWREDRRIMERICPHGVGHPDPDGLKVRSSWAEGAHGCDGCCRPDERNDDD